MMELYLETPEHRARWEALRARWPDRVREMSARGGLLVNRYRATTALEDPVGEALDRVEEFEVQLQDARRSLEELPPLKTRSWWPWVMGGALAAGLLIGLLVPIQPELTEALRGEESAQQPIFTVTLRSAEGGSVSAVADRGFRPEIQVGVGSVTLDWSAPGDNKRVLAFLLTPDGSYTPLPGSPQQSWVISGATDFFPEALPASLIVAAAPSELLTGAPGRSEQDIVALLASGDREAIRRLRNVEVVAFDLIPSGP